METLLIDNYRTKCEVNGNWFIAKPLECYGLLKWKIRIKHAILVLRGKATAVHFIKDEIGG